MTSNHANGVSIAYTYDSLNGLAIVADARLVWLGSTSYSYGSASNIDSVAYPTESPRSSPLTL